MENEEEIIVDDTEETDNNEQEHEKPDEKEVENEELKKKLATIEAQKDHWRKKAQEKKTEAVKQTNLDSKDLYALMKSEVHEDDIDDVVEYATFKKIPLSEALKSSVVKNILSEKAEFRKTAEVANTSNARKSASKVTDTALLHKVSQGEIPTSKEEAEQLFWARRGGKR